MRMDPTPLLAYWLYFILAAYLTLLVVVAVRRVVRGKAATESAVLRIADGVAEIRQGADPATLVGLFLIAASFLWTTIGVAVGVAAISLVFDLQGGVTSVLGILYLALAAFAFFIVIWAIWLGFGCWGVVVDSHTQTVTTWWGLMRPWRRHVRALADYTTVAVRPGKRRGIRARTFVVSIEGKGKPIVLDRGSWQSRDQALELAKQIATASGLEVRDYTE
jgi:hypothetical protein